MPIIIEDKTRLARLAVAYKGNRDSESDTDLPKKSYALEKPLTTAEEQRIRK